MKLVQSGCEMKNNRIQIKLLLEAMLVGLCSGIVVGFFRFGIEQMSSLWLMLFHLAHQSWLWFLPIVIGLAAVDLIAGYFVKQYPHVGGSGIPEVKLQLAGKLQLSWWPILWRKVIGGILVISTGLFLGPEGPSLQIGSTIGQGMAKASKEAKTNERVLLSTGAASGLAAAFGAPLSGALFVLEEVFHNFSPRVGFNALAGALVSDYVVSNFFGQKPALSLVYRHTFPVQLYGHLLVLGLLLGLLGHLYKVGLFKGKEFYAKIKILPNWLYGLIPLVILIPIAYFWPLITGPGNRLILALPKMIKINNWQMVKLLVLYFVIRIVFSIISYDSGLPSGIFLPVLTMGALIGACYGLMMVQLHLLPAKLVINLIIFAMAGYFAAVIRAPFTAIMLITEMVGSLLHLMPLAVVAFIALLTDELLGGKPIYGILAQKMAEQGASVTIQKSGKEDQLTVPVYEDSQLAEKTIAQVKWPEDTLVKAIYHDGNYIVPNGQSVIKPGDSLILALDSNQRGRVYSQMRQLQGIKYDG